MNELLQELEAQWREVSQYDDIKATLWAPGDPVVDECPSGCRLVDTGWRPMYAEEEGAAGHRRAAFCRNHGYARIYVIDQATAEEHGWEPLPTA
jgi:hypothetical protein